MRLKFIVSVFKRCIICMRFVLYFISYVFYPEISLQFRTLSLIKACCTSENFVVLLQNIATKNIADSITHFSLTTK